MLVGITGKSGSGKNYICSMLSKKGFEVWDLDREAEKIRRQERNAIEKAFGTSDRKELSSLVFEYPAKLRTLEAIIYPKLTEKIRRYKFDLAINGALLHRAGLDGLCSFVIYVDAPYATRLERVMMREKITEQQFRQREASQNDVDFREVQYRCPVYVIENNGATDIQLAQSLDTLFAAPPVS